MLLAMASYRSISSTNTSAAITAEQGVALAAVRLAPCADSSTCRPAIYYAPSDAYHTTVMKTFAAITGLTTGSDISGFAAANDMQTAFYSDRSMLSRRPRALTYEAHSTMALMVVHADMPCASRVTFNTFVGANVPLPTSAASAAQAMNALNTTAYTIGSSDTLRLSRDTTLPSSYGIDSSTLLATKAALDTAIIAVRRSQQQGAPVADVLPTINLRVAPFPSVAAGSNGAVDPASLGHSQTNPNVLTTLLLILGAFPMLFTIVQVAGEDKQYGVLGVLWRMALLESAYWTSYLILMLILSTCASILCVIAAAAIGSAYPAFGNVNLLLLFFLQLLYFMSSTAMGLLAPAIFSRAHAVFQGMFIPLALALGLIPSFEFSVPSIPDSGEFSIGNWFTIYGNRAQAGIFSVFPFFHYGRIWAEIEARTSQNHGRATYGFADANISHGPFLVNGSQSLLVPPAWHNLLLMLALLVAYLLLSAYCNQAIGVSSAGDGRGKLFFLTPAYWRPNPPATSAALAKDGSSERVEVQRLTKHFNKVHAVNGIDLTMRKGRCLALLGHNGAGKSTLINMLSGLTRPTSGDAMILGHRLTTDIKVIKQFQGICPQDDHQYPRLSAREHLRLFSAFKGIPQTGLDEYIDQRLDAVGLLEQSDKAAGTYSGGMKRRLSLVSASIGDPAFVILDEPTTGMDPINRRKVWQYIEQMKRGSVLLLTTHSMEEADTLGDDICIIDHGEVQAKGSSLELKNEHGSGYQINLLAWQEKADAMKAFVATQLPQGQVVTSNATSLSVVVHREHMAHLPAFLSTLQHMMRLPDNERPIRDWGIQNASLEQVFLKLTKPAEADGNVEEDAEDEANEAAAVAGDEVSAEHDDTPFATGQVKGKLLWQMWAIVVKNFFFYRNQKRAAILLVLMPVIFMALMHTILQLIKKGTSMCPDGSMSYPLPTSPSSPNAPAQTSCNAAAMVQNSIDQASLCSPTNPFLCDVPDFGALRTVDYANDVAKQIWVQGADTNTLAILRQQTASRFVSQSPILSALAAKFGDTLSNTTNLVRNVDFVPMTDSNLAGQVQSAQQQNQANAGNSTSTCPVSNTQQAPLVDNSDSATQLLRQNFPDNAIAFSTGSGSTYGSDLYYYASHNGAYTYAHYLASPNCQRLGVSNVGAGNVTCVPVRGQCTTPLLDSLDKSLQRNGSVDHGVRHLLGSVTNTYAQLLVGPNERILSDYSSVNLPVPTFALQITLNIFMVSLMFSMFQTYISIPLMEQAEDYYSYYKTNGLAVPAYWMGIWLCDVVVSLPLVVLLTISAVIYYPFINVGMLILFMLLGVHATIGLALMITGVVRSNMGTRLVASFVTMSVTICSLFLVFGDIITNAAPMNPWASIYPPIAIGYSLRVILDNDGLDRLVLPGVLLFVEGIVLLLIAVLVTHAHERLSGVLHLFGQRFRRGKVMRGSDSETVHPLGSDDPDVTAEIRRVDQEQADDRFAVKIQHLSRHFGTFAAIDDLTLGLEKGECFGLLGPNGCGKTTTTAVLSGTLAPSRGQATVGGYDVQDFRLPNVLGVCPQRDCSLRDLTVEQNLMFFARIRGASTQQAVKQAKRAAHIVGLSDAAFTRLAGKLSGGMRRRLSIAIALLGLPPIIILDEPTTGLDPGNRLAIWNVVAKLRDRNKHCIILISHLMEEVDALTSRIGIMAGGTLRCLGNQVSLKNRFASGYTLALQAHVAAPARADATALTEAEGDRVHTITSFVQSQVAAEAMLEPVHRDTLAERHARGDIAVDQTSGKLTWDMNLVYRVPNSVDLGQLFHTMETKATSQGVAQWSLNQSSLEDVFINVAMRYTK
ncbi:hypothetical protein RI367_006522 [Sorochytrium milnesiophthora]